jgi:hypothetical protein
MLLRATCEPMSSNEAVTIALNSAMSRRELEDEDMWKSRLSLSSPLVLLFKCIPFPPRFSYPLTPIAVFISLTVILLPSFLPSFRPIPSISLRYLSFLCQILVMACIFAFCSRSRFFHDFSPGPPRLLLKSLSLTAHSSKKRKI